MKKTITNLVYVVGGIYILLDLFSLVKTVSLIGEEISGLTYTVLISGLIFDIILVIGLISALNRTEDLEDEIRGLQRNKNNSKLNDLEYEFKEFKCEIKKSLEDIKEDVEDIKKSRRDS